MKLKTIGSIACWVGLFIGVFVSYLQLSTLRFDDKTYFLTFIANPSYAFILFAALIWTMRLIHPLLFPKNPKLGGFETTSFAENPVLQKSFKTIYLLFLAIACVFACYFPAAGLLVLLQTLNLI